MLWPECLYPPEMHILKSYPPPRSWNQEVEFYFILCYTRLCYTMLPYPNPTLSYPTLPYPILSYGTGIEHRASLLEQEACGESSVLSASPPHPDRQTNGTWEEKSIFKYQHLACWLGCLPLDLPSPSSSHPP
jgi:hypothetical protein